MPLVFNRLNIDPAVASGPLVTTLNDSFALLIYFGVTLLLMRAVGLGYPHPAPLAEAVWEPIRGGVSEAFQRFRTARFVVVGAGRAGTEVE